MHQHIAYQDYLKHMFSQNSDYWISTHELAEKLGVASSSVTSMLQKLESKGLVEYRSRNGAKLTVQGRIESLKILRKHRLLELFLVEKLGYSWDEVHEEACTLEHYITDKFEYKIEEMLDFPTHDPHGDPIPDRNGNIECFDMFLMSDSSIEQSYKVARILNHDPNFLKYLKSINLVPNKLIKVLDIKPYGGAMLIEIEGTEEIISAEVSKQIILKDI